MLFGEDENASDVKTESPTTSIEFVDILNDLRAVKVLPSTAQLFRDNREFVYPPEVENDCSILEVLPVGLENPLGWMNFDEEDFIWPIRNKEAEFFHNLPCLPIVYGNPLYSIEPLNEIIDPCIPPPNDDNSVTYENPFYWTDIDDKDFYQIIHQPQEEKEVLPQGSVQNENDNVPVSILNIEEELSEDFDTIYPGDSMREFLKMCHFNFD